MPGIWKLYRKVTAADQLPLFVRFRGALYEIEAAPYLDYKLVVAVDKYDQINPVCDEIKRILEDNDVRAKKIIFDMQGRLLIWSFSINAFKTKMLHFLVDEFLTKKMNIAPDDYFLMSMTHRMPPPPQPGPPSREPATVQERHSRDEELRLIEPLKREFPTTPRETVEEGMRKHRKHWTF